MFHNWLEVQTFALDRQKELLRLAQSARAPLKAPKRPAPDVVPEIERAETGYAQWRRAG